MPFWVPFMESLGPLKPIPSPRPRPRGARVSSVSLSERVPAAQVGEGAGKGTDHLESGQHRG